MQREEKRRKEGAMRFWIIPNRKYILKKTVGTEKENVQVTKKKSSIQQNKKQNPPKGFHANKGSSSFEDNVYPRRLWTSRIYKFVSEISAFDISVQYKLFASHFNSAPC